MRVVSEKMTVTISAVLFAVTGASGVAAQALPETAGAQILKQVETPIIPEQAVKPRQEITVAEPSATDGAKIAVAGFTFEGNALFPAAVLGQPLQRFVGQKLTLAELNYAADLIGKYYQEHGYFARVVLPQQDVLDGFVRIQIVESRLDRVEIDPSASSANDERLKAFVGAGLKGGDQLNLRRLERGTLLLNQLPGGSFRTVLRAGSADGTSSVVVVSEPGLERNFSAMVDGAGSSRSGQERVMLSASLYPLAVFGDELALMALASRGVQYGRAAYNVPIGSSGMSANLAVSGLRYNLLNTPVTMKGSSEAAIVGLRYPLVFQSDQAVTLSFEGGYRRFSDRVATVVTDRSLVYGSVGLDFSTADKTLGGGNTALGINVLAGRTASQGGHARVSGYLQRRQKVTQRDSLSLRLSAQSGSGKIDQSQLLMINGTSGVAAFSNDDDVSGRSGIVGRATFEHQFSSAFKASAFYDLGKVYDAPANRPTRLQGVGVGATWQAVSGVVIDASVARPIGAPSAFSNTVKAWVSARVAF